MIKKVLFILFFLYSLLLNPASIYAQQLFITPIPKTQIQHEQQLYELPLEPIPCQIEIRKQPYVSGVDKLNCPVEIEPFYKNIQTGIPPIPESCAKSYDDFLSDPIRKHFWIEDPEITNQGKADERARQFLYWVLTTNAIDEAPVLRTIWGTTSMIAFFGVVIVAAIFGIGYIISRRTNYNFQIQVWPTVIKLGVMLLYIAFSAAIVFLLIQLSEVIMKFFIDNLGGNKLFNIYFSAPDASGSGGLLGQTEKSYKEFIGCRDLNIRVQEGVQAEVFLLKMTNVTYYVMGVMLILRKILLWFMLFVSPFLALLMPFILIRNIGWIWIGVFFQWLFYGPLLALFLGANAKIWDQGIPFGFDFSRVSTTSGYVYPTGIIITYGGPAQRILGGAINRPIGALNNGNYVDTFAEYVITLIMLWAVTFFPWWLLRIFRDYCCEGIYAMKNILMAMYDQMRGGPSKGPTPSPGNAPTLPSLKLDTDIPTKTNISVSLGSLDQIRKTLTTDISKNLNIHATKLTDVAKMETNKIANKTAISNIAYLQNPAKAQVPAERQKYMNLKTELFNRAIKSDAIAKTILAATSTSQTEKIRIRQEIMKSVPQSISVEQVTNNVTHVSKERIKTITNNYTKNIVNNNEAIQNISKINNVSHEQVKNILNSFSQSTSLSPQKVLATIAKENNTTPTIVKNILMQSGAAGKYADVVQRTSISQQLPKEQVTKIIASISKYTGVTTIIEKIAERVNMPSKTISDFVSTSYNNLLTNSIAVQQIAQESNVTAPQVQTILHSYVTNINQSQKNLIQHISTENHVDSQTVTKVLESANKSLQTNNIINTSAQQHNISSDQAQTIITNVAQASTEKAVEAESNEPIVKIIAYKSNVSEDTSKHIIQNILTEASNDTTMIQNVQQQTGLQPQQIQNVIHTFTQNVNKPVETIIQQIHESAGIPKDKVESVLKITAQNVSSAQQIIDDVAKEEGVSTEDVANTIQTQMSVTTTPEEHIEQTITIPPSVSIEDYEQVKEMWTTHYEEGEIPVSETIQTRKDWIDQEIVYITNTLNKILSSDEELRQQGLDELGFLLPIFLINNLKGEELIVYLKAKLEAAKATQKLLAKEEAVRKDVEKNKDDEEVFVDVKKEDEAAEPLHMTMEDEEEKTPQSIEERVEAVQQKLNEINGEPESTPLSMDDIKNRLQEKAENET